MSCKNCFSLVFSVGLDERVGNFCVCLFCFFFEEGGGVLLEIGLVEALEVLLVVSVEGGCSW